MEPTILFEDADYLAINKPAGLVVHADGKTEEQTLVDWILEKYPEIKEVGEPLIVSPKKNLEAELPEISGSSAPERIIYRPGIVHRIDRETSGVLLIAKNQKAFEHLKSQFQNRHVKKVYHAFVYGNIKEDDGVVDRPIARSRKDFRLWSAQRGARGEAREAVTNYRVLYRTPECTLVEVEPKTGRTHQIRVHFKAINHPVVADTLYAPKRELILGFTRLALHARKISFEDMAGKQIVVEAPYPKDFKEAIAKIRAL